VLICFFLSVVVDVDDALGCWAQQLVDTQEDNCCLHVPTNQPMNLPPQLRNSLYVRRSYRKLYDLLWDTCSKAVTPNQRPGFVLTGTPGIGKSAFALYLIQQLGKQHQIVFYEYADESSRRRLKFDFSQRSGGPVVVHCMLASVRDGEYKGQLRPTYIEHRGASFCFSTHRIAASLHTCFACQPVALCCMSGCSLAAFASCIRVAVTC
jgi:hypothetical protein